MSASTEIKRIVRDPDIYGGKPCIEGHRVAVHDSAAAHKQGYTPEQMVNELYPTLTLAEVYAALHYYHEHKDEIDRELSEDVADIRVNALADTSPLAIKVRAAIHERKQQLGLG
jgi:uncharacterized protein (DUF433 family)